MAETKATDEVRGIKVFDLWRWIAELDALRAAEWDAGNEQTALALLSIQQEFRTLACPEED